MMKCTETQIQNLIIYNSICKRNKKQNQSQLTGSLNGISGSFFTFCLFFGDK